MPNLPLDAVLAVDVGASTIKVCAVGADGELLESVRHVATPYPCEPHRLVTTVATEGASAGLSRMGVGFPGDVADGVVVEPGNLSRPGGIATEVDAALHDAWHGFDLQAALRRESEIDVRVVNDATLAALGCSRGQGRELVVTLGTGFGIALVVDGSATRIRDVGAEDFGGLGTYDEVFGEPSRARDGELWRERLIVALGRFAAEFSASTVHVGGGNARVVEPSWFDARTFGVVRHDNRASLRGAARLVYP
ncbi:MAG: ROK family protein [Acidimicrobiales bacterium]